ncbi:MAG: UDP-N-acetylmuramate dehydrogenase [Candidatus Omnitrophica bacterium]|nr:UDP-N-acetylmuramate dehydrogenase [Candidatus Omnitrophota bacterium]
MDLTVLKNLDVAVVHEASLSDFTTFRLGGKCPLLFACQTPGQLISTVQFCFRENIQFILIGSGSNLVVSDLGIDCSVIRYESDKPLIEREGNDLVVSGSTLLDDLVKYAIDNELEGLNGMSGIPGTVGGAVVGNAGAFGKQIGDVVKSVRTICRDSAKPVFAIVDILARDIPFSYRHSMFKETDAIIVSVRFSLRPSDKLPLKKEHDEILALRREKHPDWRIYPCAGSFFRNVEPTSKAGRREAAGWFLEQAGAKKLRSGGARVFDRHANIIYKSQGCRAQDVFDLSRTMARLVKDKFNIDLIREVRFVGKFDGMPKKIKSVFW